jgi:hypothetical protein
MESLYIPQNLSIYIPHVFPNITEDRVKQTFQDLMIGEVERVDFVPKVGKNGKEFKAAFLHFREWYCTDTAQNLQMRIVDPSQNARVVYDDPWHWQVLPNKNPRTKEQVEMEKTIFQLQERVQDLESQVNASVAFPPLLKRDDRVSSEKPDEDGNFYMPTQEDYERAWKKRQELLKSRGQRPNWEVEGIAPYLGKR